MADYYVDATGGNDADTGLVGHAWQTLEKVNTELDNGTFSAGDNIYFKRGETWTVTDYDDNLYLRNVTGSSGNLITFGAYDTGDDPVFDASDNGVNIVYSLESDPATYFKIENIEMKDSAAVAVWLRGAENFTLSNLTIHGMSDPGGGASGAAIYFNHDTQTWTIEDCTLYDLHGEGAYLGTNSGSDRTGYGTIKDCDIYNCGREAVDLKPGSRNVTIQDCTMWKTTTDEDNGVIIVGGSGHVIQRNSLEWSQPGLYPHAGINLNYNAVTGEAADNITIEYNHIAHCGYGIRAWGSASQDIDTVTIRYNDIVSCDEAIRLEYVTGITIEYNDLNCCDYGIRSNSGAVPGTDWDADYNYYGNNLGADLYLTGYGGSQSFATACASRGIECNATRGTSGRSAIYKNDANLRGLWLMEETSGSRADASGEGNTLTDNNTVDSSADSQEGSRSADFESTNSEYLSIADASQSNLDITGDMTVAAWIKAETITNGAIVSKYNPSAGNRSYSLRLVSSGRVRAYLSSDGSTYSTAESDTILSAGTWYHVGFVYNSRGELTVFIDGRIDEDGSNPTAYSSGIHDSGTAVELGRWADGSYYFDGLMDAVAVFDKALTPWEMAELFENGILDVGGAPTVSNVMIACMRQAISVAAAGNTQDFTDADLGATAKAALYLMSSAITDGTAADHARLAIGATDGTSEWSCSCRSEHGQGTTDCDRWGTDDETIQIINTDATIDGEAAHNSFIANGHRLTIGNQFGAAYLTPAVLFAGSGLEVEAGTFTPAAAEDDSVTENLSITPDLVIFATHGYDFDDGNHAAADMSIGFAANNTPVEQACFSVESANGAASADLRGRATNSYAVGQVGAGAAWDWALEISFGADQFVAVTREGGTSNDEVSYLALAFGGLSCKVGVLDAPAAQGEQTISALGFEPQFGMALMTHMPALDTAYQDDHAGSVGVAIFDADDVYSISIQDEDAEGTSDTQSLCDDAIALPEDDGSQAFVAGQPTFTATGWTWDFTSVRDDNATVKWIYAAIEKGGGTIIMRRRLEKY